MRKQKKWGRRTAGFLLALLLLTSFSGAYVAQMAGVLASPARALEGTGEPTAEDASTPQPDAGEAESSAPGGAQPQAETLQTASPAAGDTVEQEEPGQSAAPAATDTSGAAAPFSLTARLCGADGTAVTLAAPEETAAVARGWGRDEVRTLEIDFALTEGTQPRLLTVELPLGLAFVPEGLPTGDVPELAAVDYTPCTLTEGYTADATGGTLRCTLAETAQSGRLSLPVRIDEALWNKQPGAALTAEAVTVALTAGERTETRVLAQALAAEQENQYSASAWTDDALTEKKPLDEPVLLGARGVGLARTGDPQIAPAQYWRTLTLRQEAPYRLDGDGQKVYAQYAADAVGMPAGATISYDEASHTVTAVWQNTMFAWGQPTLNACFLFPSDHFTAGEQATYPQPQMTAVDWQGNEIADVSAGGDALLSLAGQEPRLLTATATQQSDAARLAAVIKKTGLADVKLRADTDSEKARADQWAYDEERTLHIDADFTGLTGDRVIVITLPVGMAFSRDGYTKKENAPTIIEDVQFDSVDYAAAEIINLNKTTYNPDDKAGVLTYRIQGTADKIGLDIFVRYDEQLWNKQSGVSVTGEVPAIEVKMTAGAQSEVRLLDEVISAPQRGYYNYYNAEAGLRFNKPLDQAVFLGEHRYYSGRRGSLNSTPLQFWRQVVVTQEDPYRLNGDGTKTYATYAGAPTMAPTAAITGCEITHDNESHIVTVTYKNVWNTYSQPTLNGNYSFPSTEFAEGDVIIYPPLKIQVKGIYGGFYPWSDEPQESEKVSFVLSNKASMEIGESLNGARNFPVDANSDTVYPLIGFSVKNIGAVDSGRTKVTYTVTAHGKVGVTTFRLVMPKRDDCVLEDGKVKVSYTCLNAAGQPVDYTSEQLLTPAASNGTGIILSRDETMVASNYYFGTVSYDVKRFQWGSIFFQNSSPGLSGGMIYGRLIDESKQATLGEELVTIELALEETQGTDTQKTAQSYTVKPTSAEKKITMMLTDQKPMAIEGQSESPVIPAGGTVWVQATLEAHNYPYQPNTSITEPVYYLRLPKGELSLVEGSLSVVGRSDVHVVKQTALEEGMDGGEKGYEIIPITFSDKVLVGYYDEKLGSVTPEAKTLTLRFQLQAKGGTAPLSYDLRKIVCAASNDAAVGRQNGGAIVYNWDYSPAIMDKFSKSLFRITYSSNKEIKTTFKVMAAAPTMELTAAVKNTTDTSYGSGLTFVGQKGQLDYQLSFENDQDGEVDGDYFYHLIQLPKAGERIKLNGALTEADFTFSLTKAAELAGTDPGRYEVGYSIETPPVGAEDYFYDNGRANFEPSGAVSAYTYAAYLSAEEVEKQHAWAEVRCVKLIVKRDLENRKIGAGQTCRLTLKGMDWDVSQAKDNQVLEWASFGRQRYQLGEKVSESETDVNAIALEVHPYALTANGTLTGVVKGAEAEAVGTTKQLTLTLPGYHTAIELKVDSIKIKGGNFNLVEASEITAHAGDTEGWGNGNFSLTAAMNGKSVDLLTDMAGKDASLGSIPKDAAAGTPLTISLNCTDLLDTNPQVGTVEIIFATTDGVKITVTVDLRTIGLQMRQGDVTARLAQNKQFAGVKNDIGGLIVTADSAVSVQFDVYNYLHTSYQSPVLSGSFPAGLRLILADITDPQKPRYFYYTAAEAKTEVPLTDFVSMADGATRFATAGLPVDISLVAVADYAEATGVTTGGASLTLTFTPAAGQTDQTKVTAQASWTLSEKRSFNLTNHAGVELQGKGTVQLKGTITSAQLPGNDTRHGEDYMTLALTLLKKDGTTKVDFPTGTVVRVGADDYAATENKCLISLGKVGSLSTDVEAALQMKNWGLETGEYIVRVGLYCASVGGYIAPGKAEMEVDIPLSVKEKPAYGLQVSQAEGSGPIAVPGGALTYKLAYAAADNAVFAAALYAKNGDGYSSAAVQGVKIVFDADNRGATVTLPQALAAGTYRLVFTMTTAGETYTVPCQIIVQPSSSG